MDPPLGWNPPKAARLLQAMGGKTLKPLWMIPEWDGIWEHLSARVSIATSVASPLSGGGRDDVLGFWSSWETNMI